MSLRLYDQTFEALPEDLYVPPEAFEVWLEQFEGPLDFLLYLVKKNGLDLSVLAILPITEQYLTYISRLSSAHFELAGDYLLMAASLIDIKTRLMLPAPQTLDSEEHDPTAELLAKLADYAQIKEAAKRIDALLRLERDFFSALASLHVSAPEPKRSASVLRQALLIMHTKPKALVHSVEEDTVPLAQRMGQISEAIFKHKQISFSRLLDPSQGRVGVVVSLVAVLELMRQQLISACSALDEPLELRWSQP